MRSFEPPKSNCVVVVCISRLKSHLLHGRILCLQQLLGSLAQSGELVESQVLRPRGSPFDIVMCSLSVFLREFDASLLANFIFFPDLPPENQTNGYVFIHAEGGLNQQRIAVCNCHTFIS